MVSVIIPARYERFLQKTVDEVLSKTHDTEVIVILDGYWPDPVLKNDPRVRVIHFGSSKGMRAGINAGVSISRGKYILKLDAHCMVDEGIDEKLESVHQDNWIQTPRRKRLNAHTWQLTDLDSPDIDYMFIRDYKGYKDNAKNQDLELKNKLIDDTDIFQGSCYFMTKDYFLKLGLLDDVNFGKIGSEALEIALKCKRDGGRIIVNKTTWYAHAHIGALYAEGSKEREKSREYIKVLAQL